MTEEQARKFMQEQGMELPDSVKKSKKSSNKSSTKTTSSSSPGQGQGWWDEPIRHALASMGVQTTFSGKDAFDDFGSVYHPSEDFRKQFKSFIKGLENDELKDILKEGYKNPEELKDLDEDIKKWLERELGSIMHQKKSQEKRNQLVDGNYVITEEEYEKLKDINRKLMEDEKSAEMWVKNHDVDIKNDTKEAEKELREFAKKWRQKTSNDKKYRMKVKNKMAELLDDLQQQKADKKYGDKVLEHIQQARKKVEKLFDNAMKEGK